MQGSAKLDFLIGRKLSNYLHTSNLATPARHLKLRLAGTYLLVGNLFVLFETYTPILLRVER